MDELLEEVFGKLAKDNITRITDTRFYFEGGGSSPIKSTLSRWPEEIDMGSHPKLFEHFYNEDRKVGKLQELLMKNLNKYNSKFVETTPGLEEFEDILETFTGFDVCHDVSSNSTRYFLYDFENCQEIIGIDGERYLHQLNSMRQKNEPPVVPVPIFGEYNPYRYEESVYEKEMFGRTAQVINRFSPPAWMLRDKPENPTIHPSLVKFFDSVFTCPEQRKMVFSWIRNMILTRNGTILALNGARATGKTILGEKILPPLIGLGNFRKSGEGFLKKEFNSIMSRNRLVYVDEFALNNDGMTKIKNYLNDTISIEGKGQDERMEKNFCSVMYSSNHITDISIKWDERRFSIIETRKDSLLNAMSGEEITELVGILEDEEVIYNFAHWILKHGEHEVYSDINFHFKGEHFYRLVRANLTNWQRAFIEGVRNEYLVMEEFDYKYIKKKFFRDMRSTAPDNMSKLSDFLNNFKSRKGEFVGSIVPSKDDEELPVFKPNKEFFKTWSEDLKKDFEYLSKEITNSDRDREDARKIKELIEVKPDMEDIF